MEIKIIESVNESDYNQIANLIGKTFSNLSKKSIDILASHYIDVNQEDALHRVTILFNRGYLVQNITNYLLNNYKTNAELKSIANDLFLLDETSEEGFRKRLLDIGFNGEDIKHIKQWLEMNNKKYSYNDLDELSNMDLVKDIYQLYVDEIEYVYYSVRMPLKKRLNKIFQRYNLI